MNAKKNPVRYIVRENKNTQKPILLVLPQAFAIAGSEGQGALRLIYRETPDMVSITPANINSGILCADSQINCGTALTNPINAAPAPSITNKAGRAQHIKVLKEPNSAIVCSTFFIICP